MFQASLGRDLLTTPDRGEFGGDSDFLRYPPAKQQHVPVFHHPHSLHTVYHQHVIPRHTFLQQGRCEYNSNKAELYLEGMS